MTCDEDSDCAETGICYLEECVARLNGCTPANSMDRTGMAAVTNGGPFFPTTNAGTTKTFMDLALGSYPYYCDFHGPSGMTGTIFVRP